MKRGDTFTHARFLDKHYQPLQCVVTATRRGWVYWRSIDSKKAEFRFREDEKERSVRSEEVKYGKA